MTEEISSSVEEREIYRRICNDFNLVFDVGVRNELSFYNIKQNCCYHLFEPRTEFCNYLSNKIRQLNTENIILNQFGLGDIAESNKRFYVVSESFVVNERAPENFDLFEYYDIKKLDDYVNESNINKIDFIKIDAEGYDYKIISGGINTIKNKVDFLQFELCEPIDVFSSLIGDEFDYYMIMEKNLSVFLNSQKAGMSDFCSKIDYNLSLIKIDDMVSDMIESVMRPSGAGGNILAVRKKIKLNIDTLMFQVTY